jgi:hypothetical protein
MNKVEALVELQLNAVAEIKAHSTISDYTAQQIHKMVSQMTLCEIDDALDMFKRLEPLWFGAK